MVLPLGWRVPVLIRVTANGRSYAVPAGLILADLLKMQGWPPHLVVVTRNGLTLAPAETALTTLENGDVLEIVRIVAGG
jgi:thiamine biosynthesis protein ThiS